jgi:hypothetical protein
VERDAVLVGALAEMHAVLGFPSKNTAPSGPVRRVA